MLLGQKIRETRENKSLSLRKLAKEIGVSPSFISQVEQSKAQPSIESLKAIAQVLEVNCSYLIGEETDVYAPANKPTAKNKFDLTKLNKVNVKNLVPANADNNLEPALLVLEPGANSAEDMSRTNGEEFLLLLAGQLEITLNNKAYTLREGDNIYFNSSVKYSFRNNGPQPAKVLWVKGS